ncbi:HNH endonuclease [Salinibacter altiplanensis]|uniref:HNH endonuclease n=1 Tax=Salinibacter altiplanensis TaxID=1803181 RepID=UPI000C9FA2A2|nr:HNH endonuclease signature motif containing protein [Salinibacter altiplanensis]
MDYSEEELKSIYSSTAGRCHLCHEEVDYDAYGDGWHVDHSKPRSEGGTDHQNNLYPAHASCNIEKGERSSREVRKENGVNGIPLSKSKRAEEKKKNAAKGGALGLIAGAFMNPPAALVATGVGAFLGHQRDPSS